MATHRPAPTDAELDDAARRLIKTLDPIGQLEETIVRRTRRQPADRRRRWANPEQLDHWEGCEDFHPHEP